MILSVIVCGLIVKENFQQLYCFLASSGHDVCCKNCLAETCVGSSGNVCFALIRFCCRKIYSQEKMPDAFSRIYTWENRLSRIMKKRMPLINL